MPSILGATGLTQPLVASTTLQNSDGTTPKSLFASPTGPYAALAILVTSTDTAIVVVDLYVRLATTNWLLGSFSIPAGTGTAGTQAIDLLDKAVPAAAIPFSLDQSRQFFISAEAAVTTGKTVAVTLVGGYY